MSRYIDADKLKPIITEWNPWALIDERYYHEEQIMNAPTEDVIPVNWIIDKLDNMKAEILETNLGGEFPHKLADKVDTICELIEEWDNEKRRVL